MGRHLASLLLLLFMAFLAVGSSDSTPRERAGGSSGSAYTSPPAVSTGQDKHITDDHRFGCSDRDYFEKLVGYAVQNDNEAFRQGLAQAFSWGHVRRSNPGKLSTSRIQPSSLVS